jgi:hypothetical protein
MQPVTHEHVSPPSSQEIEELVYRGKLHLKKTAQQKIFPKMKKLMNFLYLTWKGSIATFLEIEHKHQETERVVYQYFRFTGVEESTSCLHGVGLELYGNVHEE